MVSGVMNGAPYEVNFAKYYSELNALKQVKPSTLWIEAVVMLCVIFRERAPRARGLLRRLGQRHAAAGTPELFEAFEQRITAYLHPDKLTGHGYGQTFEDMDHDDLWDHVSGLIAVLEELEHEVFLNSGTLLGVVRDGKLIEHDDDIDLAVELAARTPEEAAREWIKLKADLIELGIFDEAAHRDPSIYKLTSAGKVEIDLFPLWFDKDDNAYLYPHTFGELSRKDIFPLQECGTTGLMLPKEPEKMLAINYGEGWRVPDPFFRFDWKTQREKFAPFLSALTRAGRKEKKRKEAA